ncbi:hypothetical protein B0H13DRAFT_1875048 [Mycena leptocephala]|nr:hypothetical protein B0H13DRAFT_1875048 [Mycena leptocephala]
MTHSQVQYLNHPRICCVICRRFQSWFKSVVPRGYRCKDRLLTALFAGLLANYTRTHDANCVVLPRRLACIQIMNVAAHDSGICILISVSLRTPSIPSETSLVIMLGESCDSMHIHTDLLSSTAIIDSTEQFSFCAEVGIFQLTSNFFAERSIVSAEGISAGRIAKTRRIIFDHEVERAVTVECVLVRLSFKVNPGIEYARRRFAGERIDVIEVSLHCLILSTLPSGTSFAAGNNSVRLNYCLEAEPLLPRTQEYLSVVTTSLKNALPANATLCRLNFRSPNLVWLNLFPGNLEYALLKGAFVRSPSPDTRDEGTHTDGVHPAIFEGSYPRIVIGIFPIELKHARAYAIPCMNPKPYCPVLNVFCLDPRIRKEVEEGGESILKFRINSEVYFDFLTQNWTPPAEYIGVALKNRADGSSRPWVLGHKFRSSTTRTATAVIVVDYLGVPIWPVDSGMRKTRTADRAELVLQYGLADSCVELTLTTSTREARAGSAIEQPNTGMFLANLMARTLVTTCWMVFVAFVSVGFVNALHTQIKINLHPGQ